MLFDLISKNAGKWVFDCYNRCWYSRKRADRKSAARKSDEAALARGSGGPRPAAGKLAGFRVVALLRRSLSRSLFPFGSFSAVSTPIFAIKYSFCSIFRDLQNDLAEFSNFFEIFNLAEIWNFRILEKFAELSQNFRKCARFPKMLKI